MIYTETIENLHLFLEELNLIHPTIKFTMNHTSPQNGNPGECNCTPSESLPFLDTSCTIKNKKVIVDLYRKPTDRNQYLLTSSCDPAHVTQNIPFSLAYRIIRICSETVTRDQRLAELRELLLSRNYKPKLVDAAIEKAKEIPRKKALEKVLKNKNDEIRRPVFAVTFDPRLPALPAILKNGQTPT